MRNIVNKTNCNFFSGWFPLANREQYTKRRERIKERERKRQEK